ncbi:Genome sequencing data, contig C324 (fragment) [Microcystis sp. T1-4]
MLRLATTFIIAAATVAVLPSAFQAIGPLLTQIIAAGNN